MRLSFSTPSENIVKRRCISAPQSVSVFDLHGLLRLTIHSSRVDVYVRITEIKILHNHCIVRQSVIPSSGMVRYGGGAHIVYVFAFYVYLVLPHNSAYLYLHHMPLTQSVRATITSIRPHTHSADTSTYLLRTRASILLNVSMDTAYRTGHFAMSNRNLRSSSKLKQTTTTTTTLGPQKLGRFNDRRQKYIRSYLYSGSTMLCCQIPHWKRQKMSFSFRFLMKLALSTTGSLAGP